MPRPRTYRLNLKNGELRQFTDTLTANVSPTVMRDGGKTKIAFVAFAASHL